MAAEEDATSCSVCQEIYNDPRCLLCGHSFCLKCIEGVAGSRQTFPCPICRFRVDLRDRNVAQLPKNFVLCNVIEAKGKTQPSMCSEHKKLLDIFCDGCDVVICSKCLSTLHKGHVIEDIDKIFIERNEKLSSFLANTKLWASMIQEKSAVIEQSRTSMEKNADSIRETVANIFKKWYDALHAQQNKLLSYLHQERDKKRHVYDDAESILKSSMTNVTVLETEINHIRSKDTAFVVQLYGSVKARQEDTGRKVLLDIKTCFTSPDDLKVEVYAPWIEEAIDNIKLTDMMQTKARHRPQKISEIQRDNINLKSCSECENLHKRQEELEKSLKAEEHKLRDMEDSLRKAEETIVQKNAIEVLEYDNKKRDLENEKAELQRRLEEEQQKVKKSQHSSENEIKKITQECEKLRKTVKEQNECLTKHEEDLIKFNKAWQKGYKRLEQDKERELNQKMNEWDTYCNTLIQQYTKEKEHLFNTIKTLKVEKDNLLTRLSRIAADRLTHENVNIADLSDGDRPTKLQEVYSELYDNEWTDAFEELTEQQKVLEKDAIKMLLDIIMSSFQKCREITWGRYEKLKYVASSVDIVERNPLSSTGKVMSDVSEPGLVKQEAESRTQLGNKNANEDENVAKENVESGGLNMSAASKDKFENEKKRKRLECTIDLSIDLEKQIKDIWRETTMALKENSIEHLSSVIETCLDIPFSGLPMTSKYLSRCIDLCWKMGVQERPLHLDSVAETDGGFGKRFDTDKFKAYTHSGRKVAFVVWPALCLYEGGPMLAKGIAQGDSSDEKKNTEMHS